MLVASLKVSLIATSAAEWNDRDNLSGTLNRMEPVFNVAMPEALCVRLMDELDGSSSRSVIERRYAHCGTQIVDRMLELTTEGVVILGATTTLIGSTRRLPDPVGSIRSSRSRCLMPGRSSPLSSDVLARDSPPGHDERFLLA